MQYSDYVKLTKYATGHICHRAIDFAPTVEYTIRLHMMVLYIYIDY